MIPKPNEVGAHAHPCTLAYNTPTWNTFVGLQFTSSPIFNKGADDLQE